jgi:hypothetical protein
MSSQNVAGRALDADAGAVDRPARTRWRDDRCLGRKVAAVDRDRVASPRSPQNGAASRRAVDLAARFEFPNRP